MKPVVEWSHNSRNLTGSQQLDCILDQQRSVSSPAFASFSQQEMQDFLAAKPHMTDAEQGAIVGAIRTRELVYRVAEAVGRVRVTELTMS